MSFSTDIETDYLEMDEVETVSIIAKKTGEDDVRLEGVKGLHSPLDRRDFVWAGSIGIGPEDTVWNIWKKTLVPVITLRPGYWIVQTDDEGTSWVIMACELRTLSTRWRCVTRKVRVNA